ncbi:hypothetical protein AWH62_00730 [Maricaulis sp. W15]|uniref:DUF4269 domain-containing protein n=1 Tax=Maricaulis sp. W15 TaxID=1772333 RepID=UPI000948AED5|nr:DUF4269 domain-containing protein [Maricaulis sp. W15]OLF81233.1 hypothetical protein AWH62_00730 [Maricaulis sp. W15]
MTDAFLPCRDARQIITRHGLMRRLAGFTPRWVGSIPLNIHGPGADIDIACSATGGLANFKAALDAFVSRFADATVSDNQHAGEASVIAKLEIEGVPVEIFGRERPVDTHESYVHWLAEHRLLGLAEDRLRSDVRDAKAGGLKTEPAFAQCLKLGGDPYVELLKLASPGDDALRRLVRQAGYATR